jgi:glycosyltransferase involved in cell wall biosynthesis
MKFSFLIPSKNRLELLRHAIASVRREELPDYEIVVADNASEQDYGAYVRSLGEPRIVYQRSDRPLPVTENWNRALALATGDYVLMLGDDDALAPGFGARVAPALAAKDPPDVVYLAGYHYCYPQVLPGNPKGYLADVREARFLDERREPFRLPREEAVAVAEAVFGFRYLFGFNSQHFLFRSGFLRNIEALGGIFQSPYPDTFAAAVSFLKARSVMVVPEPSVLLGISPKSFGYYYFNDRAKEGYDFLANESVSTEIRSALAEVVLPGDANNTNWLVAAEVARRALAPEFPLRLDVGRYRLLQSVAFLRDVLVKRIRSADEIAGFVARLDGAERAVFAGLRAAAEGAAASRGGVAGVFAAIDRELGQFWPAQVRMIDIDRHSSIADAIEWLARNPDAGRAVAPRRSLRQLLGFK